jgi:hypothetical protein
MIPTQPQTSVPQASAPATGSLNIILTYAGPFPNYFPLFLHTAAFNSTIHWTVLTDQQRPKDLAANISWHAFAFEDLAGRVRNAFGITPRIRHPYKLCDFRPALAVLFPELVAGYDFWGHCDCDVLWGRLREFTPLDRATAPPKIQMRGAYSVYRNDHVGNNLFALEHPIISYKDAFANERYCGFDEWHGLWKLIRRHKIPYHIDNAMAEILIGPSDLRLEAKPNAKHQLFEWNRGRLTRSYWDNDGEDSDEFSYMHLQKRRFHAPSFTSVECFAVASDRFYEITTSVDRRALAQLNRRRLQKEIGYQFGRIPRYIRSRRLIDRTYWHVPE